MSSGTIVQPYAAKQVAGAAAAAGKITDRIKSLGLSPRQLELNELWSWYRCQHYDARRIDWDGKERTVGIDREAIATAGFIPPGFYDAGATFPLKFRRPSAPYALAKVIVDRFTGLLFSERRHPQVRCDGDPDTEDYMAALAEAGRLWPQMILARTYGGAMGSVALGFQFVDGRPIFEVHDTRWLVPDFKDRLELKLRQIEKRYQYPVEEKDEQDRWVEKPYWYRRVIDESSDVLYEPVEVPEDGSEPQWTEQLRVNHNLGCCPVVWVQNLPVQDSIDGDPDCHGTYDMIESVDTLISQANRGIVNNCFGRETCFVTDLGVRSFRQYEDGDVVRVLTHKNRWAFGTVHSYGKQRLFSVTIQRGPAGTPVALRVTRNHRWILRDGTVTDHVEVGDRLMAAPSTFSDFEYDTAGDADKAEWCRGFVWGDGASYAKQGSRVRLCGSKARFAQRFRECGYDVRMPEYLDGDVLASLPSVPKALPNLAATSVELLRAFVRGYVDADGSRSKKLSSRWHRIQVTGEDSIAFVRTVFPIVGLYISHEFDMTGTNTNYGLRTAKTVRFSLNENTSLYFNSEWRVTAIEDIGQDEEVWCLEVPGDKSMVLPQGISIGQCDPTLGLITDAQMGEVQKGSNNAIKLPAGSSMQYLEIQGQGPKSAFEAADKLRAYVLEVAQCVLDHPDTANRTATEIERVYSSMLAKADVFREQYGQKGVLALLEMAIKAVRKLIPRQSNGSIERPVVNLPPRLEPQGEGQPPKSVPRKLGPSDTAPTLQWGAYFPASLTDTTAAVTAAAKAKDSGLIDREHASKFVASDFRVEKVPEMLAKIEKEKQEEQSRMEQAFMPGGGNGNAGEW